MAIGIALALSLCAPVCAQEASGDPSTEQLKHGKAAGEDTGSNSVQDLGAVTVTARKRDERRIDVPIAVASISGEELDAAGITNIGDAVSLAPGAAAYDAGGAFTYIQIRGVSARQGSNENGYYLDDVPFNGVTVPWYPDTRSFDIDRVEILKGPQGTLFGEGSMGGTVRVLTKKPEFNSFRATVEANVASTDGGSTGWGTKAMVNIPLVDDKLAVRLAVTDERLPGWLENRNTGEHDINDQTIKTGRIKVKFSPTERLNFDLSYWKYKSHSPGGFEAAYEDMSVSSFFDVRNEWDSSSLTAGYAFDNSQLLYVFSDGGLWRDLTGNLLDGSLYTGITDIRVRTHEIRWVSSGDRVLDWTVGYYLRTAKRVDNAFIQGFDPSVASQLNDSFSIFGETTWNISDKWHATLGLRYFEDKVDATDATQTQISVLNENFKKTSPRFSLSYAPNQESSIYASIGSGYRSGQLQPIYSIIQAELLGIDLPAGTKPDEIWSYELGYKALMAEGKVMLESALFYSDWKDVPVYIDLAGGAYSGILNSDGSRTKGVELGVTWLPNSSWMIQFGGSVIDAVYKKDLPGTNFHSGTPVFNVPKVQLNGSVAYNWLIGESLRGIARTDVVHASRRETSASAHGEAGDPITRMSARIGIESMSGWSAYVYGENLTNESGAVDPPFSGVASRLRPRTFGLQLRYSY